ncbi:MAG TPA: hypothetical protein VFW98_06480 [Gemmatimonadaceae bacterium]|nr:hypothetical protein [Gemmatimonadaceae bacterium]
MSDSPLACTLSEEGLRCAADKLLPGLAGAARTVTLLDEGLRLEFDAALGVVPRIADVIERERQCCRFLHFALDVASEGGTIALTITGPAGTRAFLESVSATLHTHAGDAHG